MANLLYSWTFKSKKDRTEKWYIIVFSIAIGLIVWGFLSKQYGMSILIIILIGFIFYFENNSSDFIKVEITDIGIKVLDSFYPFSGIKSYSIIYDGNYPVFLRLKIGKKGGYSIVDINIDNSIVEDVRNILLNFIEEDKKEDLTIQEKIMNSLKF